MRLDSKERATPAPEATTPNQIHEIYGSTVRVASVNPGINADGGQKSIPRNDDDVDEEKDGKERGIGKNGGRNEKNDRGNDRNDRRNDRNGERSVSRDEGRRLRKKCEVLTSNRCDKALGYNLTGE